MKYIVSYIVEKGIFSFNFYAKFHCNISYESKVIHKHRVNPQSGPSLLAKKSVMIDGYADTIEIQTH